MTNGTDYTTVQVKANTSSGTLLVEPEMGSTLVINLDPSITVYLATRTSFTVQDNEGIFPLGPGQSAIIDNELPTYGIANSGVASVGIIPGGTSFFQPTSKLTIPT